MGFPDSSVGKESACNAGDPCSVPGSGRSAGEGIGYPHQYSRASLEAQLVKSACNVGALGSIPGRCPGEGKGDPLQYAGLENSMDCLVHGVSKNRTRLSDFHFTSLCKSGLLNRDKLFLSSDVSFASQYSLPWAFQVALVVKNKPASARNIRDAGSFLGSARFPGEGHNNPFK